MDRERDIRSHTGDTSTADRLEELRRQAAAVSAELPGEHTLVVEAVNPRSGHARLVKSVDARPVTTDLVTAAIDHVNAIRPALGLPAEEETTFKKGVRALETSSGAAAVHLQQTLFGIPVFQAIRTIVFDPKHAITSTDGVSTTSAPDVPTAPTLSSSDAVTAAAGFLNDPGERAVVAEDGATSSQVWFDADDGLRLGWEVVVGFPDGGKVYDVIVDGHSGDVLYSHSITVSVFARANVSLPDPDSPRRLRDIPRQLNDYFGQSWPYESPFPPSDWVATDTTAGDYVDAHLPGKNPALATSVNGVMTFDPASPDDEYERQIMLFYLCSFMHDYLLLLGFDVSSGNFQVGGGGMPDPVDAIAYPGPVAQVANMTTMPDDHSPTLKAGMYMPTNRHAALDSGVIFHEYTHGLTNRLVGGPKNGGTLDAVQSSGMGEGWSDYVACTLNNRLVIGSWLTNDSAGLRQKPYDENYSGHFGMLGRADSTGTLLYQDVHNIGEIWCSALIELNRQIGSVMAIQVVVDGLKLTPANPTFLQARDAVLAAIDHKAAAEKWSQTDFENRRLKAWRAFAKFGMGQMAQVGSAYGYGGIVADFTFPPYPATIYAITEATFNPTTNKTTPSGDLLWYRHDGRATGADAWTTVASPVGNGWNFAHVFGGGDGVIYAITDEVDHQDGRVTGADLLWYRHDGWRNGDKTRWISERDHPIASKWRFEHVFSGGDGVIYGIASNGDLVWRRHDGWRDGTGRWTTVRDPVGSGWHFKEVFSGGNGVIYAVTEQTINPETQELQGGELIWYRHDGWRDGSYRWASTGSKVLRSDWGYEHSFAGKDGVIYAVASTGELFWFRHDGWHDGSHDWASGSGAQVRSGWRFRDVLCC